VAYQVSFCVESVHAVDENGAVNDAIALSVLICLEEAIFELLANQYILPLSEMWRSIDNRNILRR